MTNKNYTFARIVIHFDNNTHNKPKIIKKRKTKISGQYLRKWKT